MCNAMCAAEQSSYQVVHCMCALILSSGSELQSSSVFSCAYNLTVSLRATIFLRVLASVCMWMAWLSTNSVCLCSLLCYCIRASKKNTRCNSPKEIMIKKMLGWLWPQSDPFFLPISQLLVWFLWNWFRNRWRILLKFESLYFETS